MSASHSENFTLTRDNTLEITSKLGIVLSAPLYLLMFSIQNNVYGRENSLQGVSEFLGNPTFLTSYFAVLGIMAATIAGERKLAHPTLMQYPLVLPFIELLVYTSYEIFQLYHPKYVDNNAMDILMGGLAFVTLQQLYRFVKSFEDVSPPEPGIEPLQPTNSPAETPEVELTSSEQ